MGNSVTAGEKCSTAHQWACALLSRFHYLLSVCQCVWSHLQSWAALADSVQPQCGAKPTNPPAITDLVHGLPVGESSTQQLLAVRKRRTRQRKRGWRR